MHGSRAGEKPVIDGVSGNICAEDVRVCRGKWVLVNHHLERDELRGGMACSVVGELECEDQTLPPSLICLYVRTRICSSVRFQDMVSSASSLVAYRARTESQ